MFSKNYFKKDLLLVLQKKVVQNGCATSNRRKGFASMSMSAFQRALPKEGKT